MKLQMESQMQAQEMQQKAQLDQQAMQNKAQIETLQAQADIATQDRKTQAEAAKAEFRDSNDVTIVSGLTVGTSGSDITITSTTAVSGQPVRVTAAALTHG
jgi:hypothetical protein